MGAIEYFYGKMGEVTKIRRTLIVPNQAIATYVTQWTYDSHNRLLEMIYSDEEKVTYSYNLGGQLEKVRGYKSYGYDYVHRIVSKKQHLTQQGVQFDGTLHVGYDLAYTYGKTEGKKFQYAGSVTDGLSVNYKQKYSAQQQVIKDNYVIFG